MSDVHTKFVILGQSRSGTQLLRALLAAHPEIHCDGELLHKSLEYTKYRALRELLRLYPEPLLDHRIKLATAPVFGFNLMFYHVFLPQFTLRRLARADWIIIHLMRADLIQIALSFLIARKSNAWHRHAGDARPNYMVRIAPQELTKELAKRIRWRTLELKLRREIAHVSVDYELDLQHSRQWQPTCERIFSALNLTSHRVDASFLKTDARGHEEVIENFAELQTWLKSSPYPERLKRLNSVG